MKFLYLVTILFAVITLSSCSKEEVSPQQLASEFTNLEVGNYWVYEWYEIYPDGTESKYNVRDSVYISTDTLIDGRSFIVRRGTFLKNKRTEILLDSANSLYKFPSEVLLFTLDKTNETTITIKAGENPIATVKYILKSNSIVANVPAGEFECLNYEGIVESLDPDYQYGTRINSDLYAKNFGLVMKRCHLYNSPNNLEMRLVKFGKN
ncbi:MAG: hypothetical protein RIB54_03610 [Fulvivirga sp.]|uniref:hypothetical protein n=1 Tax=Fulvivirga sp. TaxID=1931237 RepID=UPI0032F08A87